MTSRHHRLPAHDVTVIIFATFKMCYVHFHSNKLLHSDYLSRLLRYKKYLFFSKQLLSATRWRKRHIPRLHGTKISGSRSGLELIRIAILIIFTVWTTDPDRDRFNPYREVDCDPDRDLPCKQLQDRNPVIVTAANKTDVNSSRLRVLY